MSVQSIQQLHQALTNDLKKLGSDSVVNDATRKTFNTRVNGAVLEFGHKQADPAFWSGMKHYGSGPSSRFRMRRTAVAETTPAVAVKKKRVAKSKAVVA